MLRIIVLFFIIVVIALHFIPISSDAFATSGCTPSTSKKDVSFRIITGQKHTFDTLKQDASLVAKRKFLQAACATDVEIRKLYVL